MIVNDAIKLVSELSKTVLDEPTPEILASHIALKILAELDCRGVVLGVVQREGFWISLGLMDIQAIRQSHTFECRSGTRCQLPTQFEPAR